MFDCSTPLPLPQLMIRQTSARAPLLPLLLSLLAGLILARQYTVSTAWLLTLALGGSLAEIHLVRKNTLNLLWMAVFILSATLCFWAYGNMRLVPEPTASELEMPQREMQLTLKVSTVMRLNGRYGIASCIAQVQNPPVVGRLSTGDLVYAQLKLSTASQASKLQRGLLVNATGVLTPIPQPVGNEERDHFETYLKSTDVHYRFERVSALRIIKTPPGFTRFCAAMNHRFQRILRLGSPKGSDLANIYVTMLLGDNATLTREQRERYRMTGTLHFFAISGLHIGVIAAVIAQFLRLIRIPEHWNPWIGLPLLYLYVGITGASPSAIRAFLMAAFFWSSIALRRQQASFAGLVNSAILVLLLAPDQLWDLGFQLSYTVVASILLLGLPVGRLLKESISLYQWLPQEDRTTRQRMIAESLDRLLPLFAISFSAWLASIPLCAAFFNFIAPGAIVLNLLLVYPVTIAIISGVLSMSCATLQLFPVSAFINHAAWLIIFLMDGIVHLGTTIPNVAFANGAALSELSYIVLAAYFFSLFCLHHRPGEMKLHHIGLPVLILLGGMALISSIT